MSGASEDDLRAQILAALSTIQDPDLGRDIVSLGFVKDILIKRFLLNFEVTVSIELTTPACPVRDQFEAQAKERILAIPGISKVLVKMTAQVRSKNASDKALAGVKNVIAVGSGKGGVGKSTVAVNLAVALKNLGARVGLLDADVYGPSITMMMGIHSMPLVRDSRIHPVKAHGVECMSFAFFAPVGDAVVWRGPQVAKAVEQMLKDVNWGDLDYLIVDLPPGTGDVHLSLFHSVDIAGAVVVSTPQDVALADAIRGLAMFEKMKVPVLGIVENMSGFVCPHCGKTTDIFGQGGAQKKAEERGTPFLGRVPLDPLVVQRGDTGMPIVAENPEHPVSRALIEVARQTAHRLSVRQIREAS